MARLSKFALFCILSFLFVIRTYAQEEQATYLTGKQYFEEGNYRFAMDYFRRIAGDNQKHPYKEFAAYFYALSAYRQGEPNNAKAMWLQMDEKNSEWSQIGEVRFWLSKLYFEEDNYEQGVFFAKKSDLKAGEELIRERIQQVESLERLVQLYDRFPDEPIIGRALAKAINTQPVSQRNYQLLNQLVNQFHLDKTQYGLPEIGKSKMKAAYNVAVLLPFMFENLNYTLRVEKNKFVMDLYTGMLLAADSLNSQEEVIRIYPYDTKRNTEITRAIFEAPEMKSMDLIVGPLFPGPSKVANDFSFENKINMINPLISNAEAILNNPFSFLFRADTETQALAAAQVVMDSVANKYAMVFYEKNERDSISAYEYSQHIQEAGFKVLLTAGVVDTTVQSAYELLTEKYEVGYTKTQADSVLLLPEERYIKERKSTVVKDSIEYYEEFFTLAPDSIGHIYVASSKALIASNFISAMSIRADSTQLIGRGNWKDIPTLTYEELERLGIYFIDPDYVDYQSSAFDLFRNKYLSIYKTDPSLNAMLGYEMMYYVGRMITQYGHYFQKGNPEVGFVPGQLLQGTEFGFKNSNQYVPITRFYNSKLKVVNPKKNGQNQ